MKVLIVDDHIDNRMQLRAMLETRDFSVEEAVNGVQALDLARAEPPDLIISEILMPEMDGFTLCRVVKSIERLRQTPLIFYTAACHDKEEKKLGLALGASRYIHKPTEPMEFLRSIDEVIAEYHQEALPDSASRINTPLDFEVRHQELMARKLDKKIKDVDRLRMEQALILNSMVEGVLSLDMEGKHITANNMALRLLGYQIDELIGKDSHSLWHHTKADGSSYSRDECPIIMSLTNGTASEQIEELFWRKDGSSFPVKCSYTPLIQEGEIRGVVLIFRDMTELKKKDNALKQSTVLYHELLAHMSDGVAVYEAVDDGQDFVFLEFNQA
ncbi:MAG: response regulator [gamma proteobacterium symbiont of Bathyaustriella thionipta]|nr:response regulator [gamma proteobacterium symbiont of Bathyaustriella thionipta]MCU7950087.1 response regulator [gamma proteobacterium symbiont of Bathyaustriella thionipta]MCU7952674.1 response regulator [gamma proteobacterium symbiont of Bathyaustriella thionipta]MCU7956639.1 response regulator [gamma proteobacterium symbiont of Bathyaustriella thionipta]MCU7968965.1 response regulator [gamma proteobacterium symbiont of Bathyaustriella thionipta]